MDSKWMHSIKILDQTKNIQNDEWFAFAVDELLCEQVAKLNQAVCHLWIHPSAIILGQADARLPNVKAAIDTLENNAYKTCVRHSGGAAVPLDSQVLNISLIFPIGQLSKSNYNDGFEKMYQFIQTVCSKMPYSIQKGEIVGAYCPGEYDLSVNGLKFCGIAQRRKINAYIVQAFINIEGDSVARAKLIKSFYEQATGSNTTISYPIIVPETLASLAQFATFKHEKLSVSSEIEAFIALIHQIVGTYKGEHIYLPSNIEIKEQAQKLKQRYSLTE